MAKQEAGPDRAVVAVFVLIGLILLQGIFHRAFFCTNPEEHHYESQSAGDRF